MPNWEDIQREWESSDITFKELAEKHGIKDSTIRSRKNREKWQRNATENDATQRKNVATEKKPHRAPKGNQYAKGNRGNPNPKPKFAERNTEAFKHGLFSRYIPKETLEIMGMLDKTDPVDLIWDQIQIQYAAIIRSQQVMFVASKDEMIKELKKQKETEDSIEVEYEFQFAWDRQATFLNAQSRAISELRTSIKQFMELSNSEDERRLKLEQMQLGIDKTNAEIANLKKNNESNDPPIINIIDTWSESDE